MTEAIVDRRTVLQLGGSLGITLPPEFIEANRIKAGDDIAVVGNKYGIKIIPIEKTGEEIQ